MPLEKIRTFVITEGSLDRHSQRIRPEGVDVKNFKRNPIMLFNHMRFTQGFLGSNGGALPVGLWKNIRLSNGEWTADAYVDTDDKLGFQIAEKMRKGILSAASVGIKILSLSDDQGDKVKGQKGPTIMKSELLEVSIVDIPANPKALAIGEVKKSLESGNLDNQELIYNASFFQEKKSTMFKKLSEWLNKNFGIWLSPDSTAEQIEEAVKGFPSIDTIKKQLENEITKNITKTLEKNKEERKEEETSEINDTIKSLNETLTSIQNTVKGLETKLEKLEEANKTLAEENAELETKNKDLQEKVIAIKKKAGDSSVNSRSIERQDTFKNFTAHSADVEIAINFNK